jgi:glycosyltransferase involved in cell wall biosynthesis
LKIVHVVESLDRGGLERVVCDLAREQLVSGHDARIVCLFRDGLLGEEARGAGLPVHVVGKRFGFDVAALLRLRRQLEAADPDVVHTHNAAAHYHAVLSARRRNRAVFVNTRHGMGAQRGGDRRERFFSMSLGRTAAVAAVCQAAATRLVDEGILPAHKVRVVPNGIALDQFDQANRLEARNALATPNGMLVVGTVGRLSWAKDHAFLLRAFREFTRFGPEAMLAIVGEGEERPALEQLAVELGIRHQVRFLGDRPDVPRLLPAIDIFAVSSCTEGYSVALLEACAAGIPVVATRVGGNAEIVDDRVTGLLIDHADLPGFSEALSALAASSELRTRLGSGARAWARQNASLNAMAARYEQLYAECGATGATGATAPGGAKACKNASLAGERT